MKLIIGMILGFMIGVCCTVVGSVCIRDWIDEIKRDMPAVREAKKFKYIK